MARVHNFSAGPASMPLEVLEEAAAEFVEYGDAGMSVLEMSHRSSTYQAIIDQTEQSLRSLYSIPDNYDVLFLSGGATLQFAAVPLNLMKTGAADYLVTGNFAKKAWQEAQKYGDARLAATSQDSDFDRICDLSGFAPSDGADYVHICQNNTIYGTMYHELPETGDVPLVADVSSCFLSLPLDIERYGLLYAGAQKNAGPAGVTVIIVRHDLIEEGPALSICPSYLDYREQVKSGSMLNTPNTYGIYLCGKVFDWVSRTGGLEAMEKRNWDKVQPLYDLLDASEFYQAHAQKDSRSIANVTFKSPTPELDAAFVARCAERGIVNIKGHRAVGGMRASCYNAVSKQSIEALMDCMIEFEKEQA
ncbi:MAG: 3-phosphoserine/phosphohydroxythreonine transaminase [Atopobiaceae bacterium]|nr:3-phosphoserine/phosphohydroxythreonine transaminase [Atopobiaceae bacterium]